MYEVGIPPPWWWEVDDETLATMLDLLGKQHEAQRKAMRKRR